MKKKQEKGNPKQTQDPHVSTYQPLESSIEEPLADSAIYKSNQTYSRSEAREDVYWQFCGEVRTKALDIRRNIVKRTSLMPNTVVSITAYLEKEQLKLLDLFDKYRENEVTMNLSTRALTDAILDEVSEDLAPQYLPWSDINLERVRSGHDSPLEKVVLQNWFEFRTAVSTLMDMYVEPLAYLLMIRWIRRQIWICNHVGLGSKPNKVSSTAKNRKIEQALLALYHVYLHESDSMPNFGAHPKGRVAAYKEVAKEYDCSYKYFQIWYNRFLPSVAARTHQSNIHRLVAVIPMLKGHSKAQAMALDELEIAQAKLGPNIRPACP